MRSNSLGKYTGTGYHGFSQGAKYALDDGALDAIFYQGYCAEAYGFGTTTATIEIVSGNQVLLPYFAVGTKVSSQNTRKYSVKFCQPQICFNFANTPAKGTQSVLSEEFLREEAQYREFVYENYLEIDQDLKTLLLEIARENGISADLPVCLEEVASLMRSNKYGEYDLEWSEKNTYPENSDMVTEFLTGIQKGVCRHFAAATVMMFRALGIPARYAYGSVVYLEAGETLEYNGAGHAWAEVYIDGRGWTIVDGTFDPNEITGMAPPTSFPESALPSGPSTTPYPEKEDTAFPEDSGLTDDVEDPDDVDFPDPTFPESSGGSGGSGTPGGSSGGSGTPGGSDESGESGGGSSIPGGSEDPGGGSSAPGGSEGPGEGSAPEVLPDERVWITISTADMTCTYDGLVHSYPVAWISKGALCEGHRLVVTMNAKISSPGNCINDFSEYHILDAQDKDVTHLYAIAFDYGTLTMKPRSITIRPYDESKEYDGRPLIATRWQLTHGNLVYGHQLSVALTGEQTGVGSSDAYVRNIKIIDSQTGLDVTEHYKITSLPGTLTVLPRE